MQAIDITVPQLGEGLREVIIIALRKRPGDAVARNEPIYEIETDKATTEIEAAFDGVLEQWLVGENQTVPVGSPVARITVPGTPADFQVPGSGPIQRTERAFPPNKASHESLSTAQPSIPPRTRAHGRRLGMMAAELSTIPAPSGKLMPEDIDDYLQRAGRGEIGNYVDRELSEAQRLLMARLERSAQQAVPATIGRSIDWSRIEEFVAARKNAQMYSDVSEFQVFAYCVAKAVKHHAKFRSRLLDRMVAREYSSVNLGIAVAKPNHDLVTAVVSGADTLCFSEFIKAFKRQVVRALKDGDQAKGNVPILLSYLGKYDIEDAIPTLVAPAVATLFVGSPEAGSQRSMAKLSLTFDHRLINGVAAATFLQEIDRTIHSITSEGSIHGE